MTLNDNLPSVKRVCLVSLVASTVLLLHWLRCCGATSPMLSREEAKISRNRFRVPHGANIIPLLSTSICDNLPSKNNLKNSGHDQFCRPNSARLVLRPEKKGSFSVLKAVP